jgi:hypothetical protein
MFFSGKGILKDTIIPRVDGAVRVITMQITTLADTIMEVCSGITAISRCSVHNTACELAAVCKSCSAG